MYNKEKFRHFKWTGSIFPLHDDNVNNRRKLQAETCSVRSLIQAGWRMD